MHLLEAKQKIRRSKLHACTHTRSKIKLKDNIPDEHAFYIILTYISVINFTDYDKCLHNQLEFRGTPFMCIPIYTQLGPT